MPNGRQERVASITHDLLAAPGATVAPSAAAAQPVVGTAPKRNKAQQRAAAVITADARCTPVRLRAAIVGRARMPKAAIEIAGRDGQVLGHVTLPNTSAAFDPELAYWLVGEPTPGSVVALVSDGGGQVLLPGSRLRPGPVREPEWSPLACRMLGWQRVAAVEDLPEGWRAMAGPQRPRVDNPAFLRAVARFRAAAVFVPVLFFAVCFPYLFVVRPLAEAGVARGPLLVLPVLGGGFMALWSAVCRVRLIREAERIEPGASRFGKQIAFTQSYWSGMRKPAAPWTGPLPWSVRPRT